MRLHQKVLLIEFGRNPMFSPSLFRETIRGMVLAFPARFSSYYDLG